jgi:hypothetical protein
LFTLQATKKLKTFPEFEDDDLDLNDSNDDDDDVSDDGSDEDFDDIDPDKIGVPGKHTHTCVHNI